MSNPPVFDMFSPEMCIDPYPQYAVMRQADPVHESPLTFFMLFRHSDVAAFFVDKTLEHKYALTQQLRGGPGALEETYYDVFRRMVFVMDNPDHRRVRLLFAKSFTPLQVRRMYAGVRATADSLVDSVLANGGMDFVADFALPLPIRVIGQLLGVPESDQDHVGAVSHLLSPVLEFLPMDPKTTEAANKAVVELADYFRDLAAYKRASPGDDLLTQMIAAVDDNEDLLDDEELIANAILLYLAGHETTTGASGLSVLALHRNPDQLALLKEDPGLIPDAVSELLRYDCPGQATARITTAPVTFGDVTVPEGRGVVAWIGSANRDPEKYPDPDRLDVRRRVEGITTFGGGAHYCVGHALARQELAVTLEVLLDRLPNHRLLTLDPPFRDTALMRGVTSLHMQW